MKKILLFFVVLTLVFGLSACLKLNPKESEENINADGRAETGTVIDITSLNGQTVNAKLGDVIYIKLTGQANKGYQWSIASPTAADYLMLKDHKNSGLNDPNAAEGKFTDEWWLKVQNPGEFDLQFDYGQTKKPTTQTFKIKIITQ